MRAIEVQVTFEVTGETEVRNPYHAYQTQRGATDRALPALVRDGLVRGPAAV